MAKTVAPYGTWRSPITAELLAEAGISLGYIQTDDAALYWIEGRPLEQGRYVIVRRTADGVIQDVTPPGYNARTMVHEYGGGAYLVAADALYFSNFADQRLYRQSLTPAEIGTPTPITPEPPRDRSLRYADGRLTADGQQIICVHERHEADGTVINELVILPTDGSAPPKTIASGYDFYAAPRISPDGTKLTWLSWNHPLLPWDGTELWVADLAVDGTLSNHRHVAGSAEESICQPEWAPDGTLTFVSDRTDWWNLYQERDGEIVALAPLDAEFGRPHWTFGVPLYEFVPNGDIAAIYSQDGVDQLSMINRESKNLHTFNLTYTSLQTLSVQGDKLWLIGGSPTQGATLFQLDLGGKTTTVRESYTVDIEPTFFSTPEPIAFPTENNLTAHAIFYPPTTPLFTAPAEETPPLIVICHGGPTGATKAQLSLSVQFWTTRGFGVVDVNYGGSSGYGRAYRQRLQGTWGITDVMDCINAARYLIAQGRVDGERVAIRGGSAGGYTTLRALTWQNFFAAGASLYGLAELETFVNDTHKFESRYLDYLIGPYPAEKALYAERSPVNRADQLETRVILLQGEEDKIVPPSQAEIMVEALAQKNVPYAYLLFPGEQHGFRQAKHITRAYEAELYFYGAIFHFAPADEIEPVTIHNL
ncbi:MAG TPA: prolyl oligopeptidase family serine peptidase [Caldilineaceae bacterium]|nr:prolyl oligopeptidase family serine peptidase [Caldilineaceae bacterium]